MTVSKELFLAILPMDSYNRGYGAGIGDGENLDIAGKDIDGLCRIGSRNGSAVVKDDAYSNTAQTAGFYPVA